MSGPRLLKLAWYWLLAFKLACDEMIFGHPNWAASQEHRRLHGELFDRSNPSGADGEASGTKNSQVSEAPNPPPNRLSRDDGEVTVSLSREEIKTLIETDAVGEIPHGYIYARKRRRVCDKLRSALSCPTCEGRGEIVTGECREAMSGPTCMNPACPGPDCSQAALVEGDPDAQD